MIKHPCGAWARRNWQNWAFAWAGGQALARFCLDNPDELTGKSLIDFASGSGLVAIAACMAGARSVLATDIDPFSIEAMKLNARQNKVRLQTNIDDILCDPHKDRILNNPPDLFLAGDVFYDQIMTNKVLSLMLPLAELGTKIYVGDPQRSYLPARNLEKIITYNVPVTRELEDYEIRSTSVWRFVA